MTGPKTPSINVDTADAIKRHLAGETLQQIALPYNCSKEWIRQKMEKMGYAPSVSRTARTAAKHRADEARKRPRREYLARMREAAKKAGERYIVHLYRIEKLDTVQIGQLLEVPQATVHKILVTRGAITPRKVTRRFGRVDPAIRQKVIKLCLEGGRSQLEIGHLCGGLGQGSVSQIWRKFLNTQQSQTNGYIPSPTALPSSLPALHSA